MMNYRPGFGKHLYHSPAAAKPVPKHPHKGLPNDDTNHLKVVCGFRPDLVALCVPA